MQRVLVIGSGGAGKSWFATQLGERTGLPVLHLDAHFWRPGWVETPSAEWLARVETLSAQPRWIMDGNYGGTLAVRLARCDTVLFLDLSRTVCAWSAIGRAWRYRGKTRPDMAPGCPERMTLKFLRWIWSYPTRRRHDVLRKLAAAAEGGTRVVRLRSRADAARFLDTVGASP